MRLDGRAMRSGTMVDNVGDLVRATVVIANGTGSGSGFFIAADAAGGGWILTNDHVVGDSERVRVSTSNWRARIGTVVRRHRVRDVALIHVDGDVPAVVSVRDKPVVVGEEVFAVGEPLGTANRNTVTRGIVSRFTKHPTNRLSWIQSDVMIQHGSSGGPLADASGNVVALAVAGVTSKVDRSVGLNYFIPIGDVLDKLKLDFRSEALTGGGTIVHSDVGLRKSRAGTTQD